MPPGGAHRLPPATGCGVSTAEGSAADSRSIGTPDVVLVAGHARGSSPVDLGAASAPASPVCAVGRGGAEAAGNPAGSPRRRPMDSSSRRMPTTSSSRASTTESGLAVRPDMAVPSGVGRVGRPHRTSASPSAPEPRYPPASDAVPRRPSTRAAPRRKHPVPERRSARGRADARLALRAPPRLFLPLPPRTGGFTPPPSPERRNVRPHPPAVTRDDRRARVGSGLGGRGVVGGWPRVQPRPISSRSAAAKPSMSASVVSKPHIQRTSPVASSHT